MPMCGFNKKMLEGMNSFHNGLIEFVLDKSQINKQTEEDSFEEEN